MTQSPKQRKQGKVPIGTAIADKASNDETAIIAKTDDSAPVECAGDDLATVSPLDVLLKAMRLKWRKGDQDGAAALAKAAAPYIHPRANGSKDEATPPIEGLSDAELIQLAIGGDGIDGPPDDAEITDGMG